jgi:hypothetical protein
VVVMVVVAVMFYMLDMEEKISFSIGLLKVGDDVYASAISYFTCTFLLAQKSTKKGTGN